MAGERSKKETIQFNQLILAGASYSGATALKQQLRAPCTIQRIYGQFFSGQQNQLQIRPYLRMTDERDEELITYPVNSNRYMSGDNTNFDISIDFDAQYGYFIQLDVNNLSTYDYTMHISFEVDYVGGTSRVV